MKLRKIVKFGMNKLGIKELRRNQIKPINAILDGHDTMVIAPTSYGKSLIYQIPAITMKKSITVVIEPLLALMHDQVKKLCKHDIAAAYLDSTQSKSEQKETIEQLRQGEIKMLYLSPERLNKDILSEIEENNHIGMIVVDECHCVLDWGSTFRKAYLSIGKYVGRLKQHPIMVALSATVATEDRPTIKDLLSMRKAIEFQMPLYRSNLCFMKTQVKTRDAQLKELKKYLRKYHKHTTIIFCNTKRAVKAVAKKLESVKKYRGEVIPYHGEDKTHEKDMMTGQKHIIVATTALSLGVDIPNVDLVIHFNMPHSIAEYCQMSGRAGREGQHARSILLYNPDDYQTNWGMTGEIKDEEARRTARNKLNEMKEFCEDSKRCMVKTMLNALGDEHEGDCRYCTNCQKKRRKEKK